MAHPSAPTQLLAVSGPFHYWGPVVDGQYLRQAPATALQKPPRAKVDLLIGSSQDDGLINRAKAVKVGGEQASEALLCAVLPVPPWARASTYLLVYKTVAEKLRCAKFAQGAWEAARGSQNPERRRQVQPHAPSVDESLWETASRGRPKSSVPAGLQGADTPVPPRTLVPLSLGEGEAGV